MKIMIKLSDSIKQLEKNKKWVVSSPAKAYVLSHLYGVNGYTLFSYYVNVNAIIMCIIGNAK